MTLPRLSAAGLILWACAARAAQVAPLQVQPIAIAAPAAVLAAPVSLPAPSILAAAPIAAAPALVPSLAPIPALMAAPALTAAPAATLSAATALAPGAAMAPESRISAREAGASAPSEGFAAQAASAFDGAARAATPADITGPRLIITGPPGSGKGTYSEKISADYGVVHVSVGELLRSYAKTHPEVAAVMATGRLVDSSLVLRVVRERLSQPDILKHGFLLDGFPRRQEEAAELARMLGTDAVDGVIELNVPENELLRRILARGRADDHADVFQERMRIYREQTVPAVERFKTSSPVLAPKVTGSDIESNYARVKAALGGLLDKLVGRGS